MGVCAGGGGRGEGGRGAVNVVARVERRASMARVAVRNAHVP